MYKKWNKDIINEQIKQITKLNEENPSEITERDLETLQSLANNRPSLFETSKRFPDEIKYDRLLIEKYSPFIKEIREFERTVDDNQLKGICGITERNIQQKYLLSFVHDFYNSIDPDFKHIFNKVFDDRRNNLRLTRNNRIGYNTNYMSYIRSLKYPYINVYLTDTIDDFLNIVHEYAHAVSDYMCFRPQYGLYPFAELLPIFMEKLAAEMVGATFFDDYVDADIAEIDAITTNTMLKYSNEILLENDYLSSINELSNRKNFISNMASYTGNTKAKIERMIDIPLEQKLAYTIPYLTMIEFYTLYNKDPKKCMYLLKELLKSENVSDYYKYLQDRDIILNEHTKEYIDDEIERIRLTRNL